MTGWPGKELAWRKVEVVLGEEEVLILDMNDFGDLSKVNSSAIGQSKKREEIIDKVKVKTTIYNGEDDFEAGDLKATGATKTIGAPEKPKLLVTRETSRWRSKSRWKPSLPT